MTRPISQFTFLAGKIAGNTALIALALVATFATGAAALALISGVGLVADDLLRIALVLGMAIVYVTCFFLLGFILALYFKNLSTALMVAFAVWLVLVLVAPQIGDTMDPDNQVAGGVFRKLEIAAPLETEILESFNNYEVIRDAIEEASPAKHLERFSFALLGITTIYSGQTISSVIRDRSPNVWSLLAVLMALSGLLFLRPLDFTRLSKE
jgi:ABC-2 type transport system permease protein